MTLIGHIDDLSNQFRTSDTLEKKEAIASLMKEAHKINKKLEKLIVAERQADVQRQRVLQRQLREDIGLLELHITRLEQ